MIYPSKEFRKTTQERFNAFFENETRSRNYPGAVQLDENSAWVAWQAAESMCCSAFYDAGSVLIPEPATRFDVDKIKQAIHTGNGHFKCVATKEEIIEFNEAYLYILFDYHRYARPKNRLLVKGKYLYVDGNCGFNSYGDANTFENYSKSYRQIDIKSLYKTAKLPVDKKA